MHFITNKERSNAKNFVYKNGFRKKNQHIKYEESFKEGYAVNLLIQITL